MDPEAAVARPRRGGIRKDGPTLYQAHPSGMHLNPFEVAQGYVSLTTFPFIT
jgi:hypothetical protein